MQRDRHHTGERQQCGAIALQGDASKLEAALREERVDEAEVRAKDEDHELLDHGKHTQCGHDPNDRSGSLQRAHHQCVDAGADCGHDRHAQDDRDDDGEAAVDREHHEQLGCEERHRTVREVDDARTLVDGDDALARERVDRR